MTLWLKFPTHFKNYSALVTFQKNRTSPVQNTKMLTSEGTELPSQFQCW